MEGPQDTLYSLWLRPETAAASTLGRLIDELGRRYGSPVFLPHITLLGSIAGAEAAILRATRRLAQALNRFEVALGEIDYLPEYYRCLFIRVEPGETLLAANRQAKAVFEQAPDKAFMPHLSLLYAELDEDRKRHEAAELARRYPARIEIAGLDVYTTSGDPRRWRCIASFGL